ncbi:MAG: hypothetical protein H0V24_04565 [Chloroflexia bacterium]|nr:hypothetical protein [Chloroflexia bacterium]
MDFPVQLARQLRFIQTSCAAYDQGEVDEGIRIAAALRIVFHDTKSSTSLMTHLRENTIDVLSTCDAPKPSQQMFAGMTNIELDPPRRRMEWVPKYAVPYGRLVPFNKWWFQEIVYLSKAETLEITRGDLVLGAANKDGGAHVDVKLEPRYEHVLQGLGWSMTVNPDGEPPVHVPCRHGHLSALRQMGYEVLHTPDLLKLAGMEVPSQAGVADGTQPGETVSPQLMDQPSKGLPPEFAYLADMGDLLKPGTPRFVMPSPRRWMEP